MIEIPTKAMINHVKAKVVGWSLFSIPLLNIYQMSLV